MIIHSRSDNAYHIYHWMLSCKRSIITTYILIAQLPNKIKFSKTRKVFEIGSPKHLDDHCEQTIMALFRGADLNFTCLQDSDMNSTCIWP